MPKGHLGREDETIRVQVRMPVWMFRWLQDQAAREEVYPSMLIRRAIQRTFFSASNGNSIHTDGNKVRDGATR